MGEASNSAQRRLLELLGFTTVGSSSGRGRVGTSPAGFTLCECEVAPALGQPGDDGGLMPFIRAVSATVAVTA